MVVEYKVEVYSTTYHTKEDISIKLIGTKSESPPQFLSTYSYISHESHTSMISCPKSIGDVLMVELEASQSFWDIIGSNDWFCSKLVITTPEGTKLQFPCYRSLDSKNPVVRLLNDKAFICVPRTKDELDPVLPFQRNEEIKQRQQDYKWKLYRPGFPSTIDAESPSDLPVEVQFSFTKYKDLIYNLGSAAAALGFETFLKCHETWKSQKELEDLMQHHRSDTTKYVIKHWKQDEFFGYQLLNGLNPMMIERCSKLPPNFPVTDEMVQFAFPGSSLTLEMKKGNIFMCDYKRLSGLEGNVIDGEQQYLTSPLCLLFSNNEKLIPIAIQLHQNPAKKNPIFFANEPNEWDWILAKTFVRCAEFSEHELNFHLLRTHLLAEVFTVSTMRNLPSSHPLFKLLMPHTRYTLQINIMARTALISSDGFFSKVTAVGQTDSLHTFMERAASSLTYSSLCLPDNIEARGLENIPNYYYRDDGLKLWNIIYKFVEALLKIYYKSDEDVKGDRELQNWISDIFLKGFQGNNESGIPSSFSDVNEITKFVTMVIFTVSAQHAALNNSQFDFGAWMPNFPSTLRAPPPSEKGKATEQSFLQTLPTVSLTCRGLAVLYVLSTKSTDHYPLGDYAEDLFGDAKAIQPINKFQKNLRELRSQIAARNAEIAARNAGIEVRNAGIELPYYYLNPADMDNSVAL